MLGTRHEEYRNFPDDLPFVFHSRLERSGFHCSKENNWHDNPEIQICTGGEGAVLLDGEEFPFRKNDIIVVNSDVIHYTGTKTSLTYSCLIVGTAFCKRIGIDPRKYSFSPYIKSQALADMLSELTEIYAAKDTPFRIARLNSIVLRILIELAEHHIAEELPAAEEPKSFETVRSAISYIRMHYREKIRLDDISEAVLYDKYALCREFRRLTGQTIVWYLNHYRCLQATDCLSEGYTVAQTASLCGFDNLSFFTKTFKKHIGKLPSEYKK